MPKNDEYCILIDVPTDIDNSIFLEPIRDKLSAMDLLISRLNNLVGNDRIILLTNRPRKPVFNVYSAMKGVHLFPSNETNLLRRILLAVATHRLDTFVRVRATHPLTDPELLKILIDKHLHSEGADLSTLKDVPEWLCGEVISTDGLQRAYNTTRTQKEVPFMPREFFDEHPDDFKCVEHVPAIRGNWQDMVCAIGDSETQSNLRSIVLRAPDPVEISYKLFLK